MAIPYPTKSWLSLRRKLGLDRSTLPMEQQAPVVIPTLEQSQSARERLRELCLQNPSSTALLKEGGDQYLTDCLAGRPLMFIPRSERRSFRVTSSGEWVPEET